MLESSFAITGITNANPAVATITGNNYNVGDWIYIADVAGMTQINGRYFQVLNVAGASVTLGTLNGANLDTTAYGTYTSGGTAARIYTLTTLYNATDLALLKFAQNDNFLVLAHTNYTTQILTLQTANSWTLLPMTVGATVSAPSGLTVNTTLSSGSAYYSYVVTSIDANGQESSPSSPVALNGYENMAVNAGTNLISWTAQPGAVSYNVYKANVSYYGAIPTGAPYGFIGNVTGISLPDTNIQPDFTTTPPIAENPFLGDGIASLTLTANTTYTEVPAVSFSGGTPTTEATAIAPLTVTAASVNGGGAGHPGGGYRVGDLIYLPYGVVLVVTAVTYVSMGNYYEVSGVAIVSSGAISAGSAPSPVEQTGTSGVGFGFYANLTWEISQLVLLNPGAGYLSAPTVVFSPSGATATATLESGTAQTNPGVVGFFQQRLTLAAALEGPQTLNFSQPGNFYNFNSSNPTQASDAIEVTLASGQLNTIKSMVSTSAGLIVFTDKGSWLINGGSAGSAISPSAIVANAQSYEGASDVPPIVSNFDILFVQAKGSIVRDSTYNFYANVFTGNDISVQSSHLFYGYTITQWAWAEEPFKIVWCVRSDGTVLSLTFVKDQNFIGWSHHVSNNGSFQSVATVVETGEVGTVDAVYFIVERTIESQTVQYIERLTDIPEPQTLGACWQVDSGIQYSGSAQTTFTGAESLAGQTVTGLQTDDQGNVTIITPFVMPATGIFTLPSPPSPATGYTLVTLGLAITAQLQTLPIELGEPTVQGKMKVIPAVNLRVANTLGLQIGSTFQTLVNMFDLELGRVGSQTNQLVTGLVTGDALQRIDALYSIYGQYCVQQQLPYPASILAVMPQVAVGDTK